MLSWGEKDGHFIEHLRFSSLILTLIYLTWPHKLFDMNPTLGANLLATIGGFFGNGDRNTGGVITNSCEKFSCGKGKFSFQLQIMTLASDWSEVVKNSYHWPHRPRQAQYGESLTGCKAARQQMFSRGDLN